ncbi:MAG: preprotein translocase subunit SecY [Lachnospirales bacterium]
MFTTLKNAFKVRDLRIKMLYMLLVLVIVRLGTYLPIPGVDIAQISNSDSNIYQLITGGNYGTVFAMGIGPYINASIIMQLLTVAIPKLEEIKKDGEEGNRKISQYTRIAAVILALLQGAGQIYTVNGMGAFTNAGNIVLIYVVGLVTMVTGTIFIMWMGEKLTEVGIGNGASFIIYANILSGMANGFLALKTQATGSSGVNVTGLITVCAIVIVLIVVMGFVVLVQDGERRIPVQYSNKLAGGGRMMGGQSSYIPIKVNIAGVMSIIFAISLLQFPYTINQLIQSTKLATIAEYLSTRNPVGAIIYVILIFCFTFFYTSFAFNPAEVAENMKKNGGFVPGIRPGKPTGDYIQKVVDRISFIGGITYALIAMVPVVLGWATGMDMGFGGTTLLIVTGVALEIVKSLESQLVMRNYKGFLD